MSDSNKWSLSRALTAELSYFFVSFRFQYFPGNDRLSICCIRNIPNLFPNVPWNRRVWSYSRSVHYACLYVLAVLQA